MFVGGGVSFFFVSGIVTGRMAGRSGHISLSSARPMAETHECRRDGSDV